MTCTHKIVLCPNEYELIRKYRCEACSQVMMCACDREIGERFLAHQLGEGCVLETQERVPVTLGFVEGICRECRGLPQEAHPTAAIPGRTRKIQRYYWREIQFETFKRFAGRAEAAGFDPHAQYSREAQALHKEVQREVLEDIKQLHATNPKYAYNETSQAEVLAKYEVEEVRLDATFAPKTEGKGAGIIDDGEIVSAEEFAARHYRRVGWQTMFVESVPVPRPVRNLHVAPDPGRWRPASSRSVIRFTNGLRGCQGGLANFHVPPVRLRHPRATPSDVQMRSRSTSAMGCTTTWNGFSTTGSTIAPISASTCGLTAKGMCDALDSLSTCCRRM